MEYTGELLRVCGIGILCSVCLLVVGKTSSSVAFALRAGGGVLMFGVLLLVLGANVSSLWDVFDAAPLDNGYFSKAFSLMLKALGIALVSRFCADICRDCGEGTLAGGVESVGRVAIFSLCLPVISDILGYAAEVLEMGG